MADKILNSFDVWIGAQGWKSKLRLKSVDNVSHEGIERLRELILELAVLGKLLPQNSSDENANALLKNITKERNELIEDGELKKQKVLPEISEDEKPFELPKGWAWAKLGNIGETNIGLTYSPNDVSDSGMPVLRSSNVQNGQISLDDLVRVSSKVDSKNFVENGDLLICARNGSKKLVGKCAIIKDLKERTSFGAFMAIFRSPLNFYIKYFLEAPFYRNRLEGVSTTTINQITQDNLKNTVIPLPPLAEQLRIVAKVDDLMALCDELEQQETNHLKSHQLLVETLLRTLTQAKDATEFQTAWAMLAQHFDDLFITEDSIDQLKQTILQLAVMGKLVKQDPNDEAASEILHQIERQKQRPSKNIKREKTPTKIPKNWLLCNLYQIADVGTGATPLTTNTEYYKNGDIPWVTSSATNDLFIEESDSFITEKALKETNCRVYPKGTLLVAMYGQGKTRGQVGELNIDAATNQACAAIELHLKDLNHRRYVKLFFQKIYLEIRELAEGGAQPNLNLGKIKETLIPLPPLLEQKRIVAKVDELFALCDSLKERITDSQKVVNLMANSIVEQV